MNVLGLMKGSATLIIRSPDKSNIKYYVKKIDTSIDMSMQWLLDWNWKRFLAQLFMLPVSNRCQTCLIICALKKTSNIHKVGMFHSETR